MICKARPGLVFPSRRYSAKDQELVLRRAGAEHIVAVRGSWRGLFRGARVIRSGDIVYVYALVLVATARKEDVLPPAAQPAVFAHEVERAGALLIEALTGRRFDRAGERDAAIADATNALREGSSRRAPKGYVKLGRRAIEVPEAEKPRLAVIWKSSAYGTAEEALAALEAEGYPMSDTTAWRLFGARGT